MYVLPLVVAEPLGVINGLFSFLESWPGGFVFANADILYFILYSSLWCVIINWELEEWRFLCVYCSAEMYYKWCVELHHQHVFWNVVWCVFTLIRKNKYKCNVLKQCLLFTVYWNCYDYPAIFYNFNLNNCDNDRVAPVFLKMFGQSLYYVLIFLGKCMTYNPQMTWCKHEMFAFVKNDFMIDRCDKLTVWKCSLRVSPCTHIWDYNKGTFWW